MPIPQPARKTRLPLAGLKVSQTIDPAALPSDLVPPEPAPAGSPTLELALGGLLVVAQLNGKGVRKALRAVAEHGAANIALVLSGTLKPGPARDGPFLIEGAGLQAIVKAPRPAAPEAPPERLP